MAATGGVEELIRDFVNTSFGWLQHKGLNSWPGTPPESMWVGDRSADGWRPWQLVPSTVTDADLDALEREFKVAYPPVYRSFLEFAHFVDLAAFGLDFERHLPGEWSARLRALYQAWEPERIIKIGLLPFGHERLADAGLVCFDTRTKRHDGDSPVVIWDHDWVETDKEIVPLYSSGRKLFECQLFFVRAEMDIHNWDETNPTESQRALVEQMLEIDPEGLGGPGRRWLSPFFPQLVPT